MLLVIFYNDTATTEIYTLSLHDALPICGSLAGAGRADGRLDRVTVQLAVEDPSRPSTCWPASGPVPVARTLPSPSTDRKSTRLNSSHGYISYAVFCLKKKIKSWKLNLTY